jgi:solute carrier family 25 S-adenosylmethionine transporter 26
MIAAVLGEASQLIVRTPFELIKQNMQIGKYTTIKEGVVDIFKTNGITGLYRGYFITFLREVPFGLIQYPLYEYFKKRITTKSDLAYAFCGAKAGAIAAFITTPIDVIKTRIMTSSDNSHSINRIIYTISNILRNESFSVLFSGVHIRVIYITVGGMFFFGANEKIKTELGYRL